MPTSSASRGSERGFVLLEILMALVLFTTVVLVWSRATDGALEAASEANSERILRLLASRKMSEVLARPEAFSESDEGGFEEEVSPGEENPFAEYAWSTEIEEVLMTPGPEDGEAVFLFQRDEDEGPPAAEEGQEKAPDPIRMLRCTLLVRWIESEPERQMKAIFFIPLPEDEQEGGQ